ncbi:hypothetical protein ORIO_18770 [Cereibacter azotoformans]|uniref:Uncharacterized protein n=1 Tax=Cereibacter sphaeroides (strain ATCC 17025 / ATH 2.4.3) TaxID=349102 RepID=A4WYF0_CERS5|nr:hypothetical protein [Cereibacter azotoformans]ULB11873.1 hypothetical protein ORIO_18770 [Cereibacter azotoformans]
MQILGWPLDGDTVFIGLMWLILIWSVVLGIAADRADRAATRRYEAFAFKPLPLPRDFAASDTGIGSVQLTDAEIRRLLG